MSTEAKPVPGEWSREKCVEDDDPHMTEICMKLKPDIEKKIGTEFKVYIPLNFRSQVVEGTNYLVKVNVNEDDVCFYALIFEALPCKGGELTVNGVQYPKTMSDPLEPF